MLSKGQRRRRKSLDLLMWIKFHFQIDEFKGTSFATEKMEATDGRNELKKRQTSRDQYYKTDFAVYGKILMHYLRG